MLLVIFAKENVYFVLWYHIFSSFFGIIKFFMTASCFLLRKNSYLYFLVACFCDRLQKLKIFARDLTAILPFLKTFCSTNSKCLWNTDQLRRDDVRSLYFNIGTLTNIWFASKVPLDDLHVLHNTPCTSTCAVFTRKSFR